MIVQVVVIIKIVKVLIIIIIQEFVVMKIVNVIIIIQEFVDIKIVINTLYFIQLILMLWLYLIIVVIE